MKKQRIKITAIILTLAITIIAHPFSIVNAAGSASATLRTSYGQSYDLQGNIYEYHRYITINIDDYATGTAQLTLSNATTYDIIAYNCQTTKSGTYLSISFEHEKFIYIELVSHGVAAAPDISSWTMSATLDDDQLDEVIYREGIIYTELLDLHQMIMENLDTYIDTISWVNQNATFKGWTSAFSTYSTSQNTSHNGGYYAFNMPSYISEYIGKIFKIDLPVTFNTDFTFRIGYYYGGPRGHYQITINEYIVFKHTNYITLIFLLNTAPSDTIYDQFGTFNIQIMGPSSTKYTQDQYLNISIIGSDDIEYWNLYNQLQDEKLYKLIQSLSQGSTETTTTNNINSITSDLNDQISASNSATSSTEALLDNFNQNMDLTDYNFSISNGDHVTYFKQKLTDIYEIDEFKPFYLIPIILFVLGRILAG